MVDTHCHIHFDDYGLSPDEAISDALKEGVDRLLCVGCTLEDSKYGVEFVQTRPNCWATIGVHPHESRHYDDLSKLDVLTELAENFKVVGIGEIGLDYHYNNSDKKSQTRVLEYQLDIAQKHNLPVVFHVREAFDDFWPVFNNFRGLRGVIHSFTGNTDVLDEILSHGLYVGLNGIMTFTKDQKQLEMAKALPLGRMVLETDAPFLTPNPFRGTICQPKHVLVTAKFLADLRGEPLESINTRTTSNARQLFNI
ncbi:MAG: TatD family hydrolase [Candidatus Saccharimonadales bacterium]